MPQINVVRDELFAKLGKTYTDDEFETLCFEYGLEVEFGNGAEMNMSRIDGDGNNIDLSNTAVYKVEVPANRYDLLCLEGLATALKAYISAPGAYQYPQYKVSKPAKMERITVLKGTKDVRQYVVSAILRNIKFDKQSFNSFIDLQDKLHQNICRRRTLCSMGTHDYDNMQGPITYEAVAPRDIKFKALKQSKEMDCIELFDVLRNTEEGKQMKLGPYLPIIEGKEKYPVFYDANRTVLSLPPIINSEATKIGMNTKNCFIEVTGTDFTKCKIVLAILSAQFSEHCQGSQFTIEPVEVVHEDGGPTVVEPTMSTESFEVEIGYVCRLLGITLTTDQMNRAAERMGLKTLKSSDASHVRYEAVAVRPDILHACDIAEEIGIGYGFNNIPMVYPPTNTVGQFIPENKFSDLLRHELAQAGYIESLTCALVSLKENYENLRSERDMSEAVVLSNPKTEGFEMVRTTLVPGLLNCFGENKDQALPQKIFEISDVACQDSQTDTGSKNSRKVCLMQINSSASFEIIHGTLGLLMTKIGAKSSDFSMQKNDDLKLYFPGNGAEVLLGGKRIGTIGVLHPLVLKAYDLKNPVSCFELDFEPLWEFFKSTP